MLGSMGEVRRLGGLGDPSLSLGLLMAKHDAVDVFASVSVGQRIGPEMREEVRGLSPRDIERLVRHLPVIPSHHLIRQGGPVAGWRAEWSDVQQWIRETSEGVVATLPHFELALTSEARSDKQRGAMRDVRARWGCLRELLDVLCPTGGIQSSLLTGCSEKKIPVMWCPEARRRIQKYAKVVPRTHAGLNDGTVRVAAAVDPLLIVQDCPAALLWFASDLPATGRTPYTLIVDCDPTKEERERNRRRAADAASLAETQRGVRDASLPLREIVANSAYGTVVDLCERYGLPCPEPMMVNVGSGGVHVALRFEMDPTDAKCMQDMRELQSRFDYRFGRRSLKACGDIDILGTNDPQHGTGQVVVVRDAKGHENGLRMLRRSAKGSLHVYPAEYSMRLLKAIFWQGRYQILRKAPHAKCDEASIVGPPPSDLGAHALVRVAIPGVRFTGGWRYVKADTLRKASEFRLKRHFNSPEDALASEVALDSLYSELGLPTDERRAIGLSLFQHRTDSAHFHSRGVFYDLDVDGMKCPNDPAIVPQLARGFIALVRQALVDAFPGDFDARRVCAAVGYDETSWSREEGTTDYARATFGMHFVLPYAPGYEEMLHRDGKVVQDVLQSLPTLLAAKTFQIAKTGCLSQRPGTTEVEIAVYEYSYHHAKGKCGVRSMFDASTFTSRNKRLAAFLCPFGDKQIRRGDDLHSAKCYRCLTSEDAALFAEIESDMWRSDEANEASFREGIQSDCTKRQLERHLLEGESPAKRTCRPTIGRVGQPCALVHDIGDPDEKPEFRMLGPGVVWSESRSLAEGTATKRVFDAARSRIRKACSQRAALPGWTKEKAHARFLGTSFALPEVKVYKVNAGRGTAWKFIIVQHASQENGHVCQIRKHASNTGEGKAYIQLKVLCDRAAPDESVPVLAVQASFCCHAEQCTQILGREQARYETARTSKDRAVAAESCHRFKLRA